MRNIIKSTRLAALFVVGIFIVNSHAQSFLTNGLIAYYPFNGNATNQITNAYNGTVFSATLTTNRFRQNNAAYYFNGASYIDFGTNLILGAAHSAFTISLWFNAHAVGPIFGDYVGTISGGDAIFACQIAVDNNPLHSSLPNYLSAGCRNNGPLPIDYSLYVGNKIIIDGAWHALSYEMDGNGTCFVFLDGQPQGTMPYGATLNYSQSPDWEAGRLYFGGQNQYFTGFIDDIRIYNRALSTNEVAQLYATESGLNVTFVKAFTVDYSNLLIGSNYQAQTSPDLVNWTNWGAPFTATSSSYTNTNYQRIADWNQLFFRLANVQNPPRPNTFILESIQAGSTTEIGNLRVVDLDTGTVVYTNGFSTASAATNKLNLFYWPVGGSDTTNYVVDGSMTRVVSGKLHLETTGFGANGNGGYDSHSEAEYAGKLPRNFLVDFNAIRLQWAGHFWFEVFYRQPSDAFATYGIDGPFSTNRSPALRLDVLDWSASGSWFDGYSFATNVVFPNGKSVTSFPAPAGDLLSTHRLGISLSNSLASFYLDGALLNSADISNYISDLTVNFVKAFTVDCGGLTVSSNYQVQASSDLVNWTNWGAAFTATSSSYTNTNYQRIANWNQLFFRIVQQ